MAPAAVLSEHAAKLIAYSQASDADALRQVRSHASLARSGKGREGSPCRARFRRERASLACLARRYLVLLTTSTSSSRGVRGKGVRPCAACLPCLSGRPSRACLARPGREGRGGEGKGREGRGALFPKQREGKGALAQRASLACLARKDSLSFPPLPVWPGREGSPCRRSCRPSVAGSPQRPRRALCLEAWAGPSLARAWAGRPFAKKGRKAGSGGR